jgi:SAM-dependent methyltransferase/uncharacterized protein YbaR (Trm112 family)
MKKSFLKYLVCPHCKKQLKITSFCSKDNEIEEGMLHCTCGRAYPIIKGVPRILPDDLANLVVKSRPDFFLRHRLKIQNTENTSKVAKEKKKTASIFGNAWHHFPEMRSYYEKQFLDWVWPVQKSFFSGKTVLDAGCGQGRHTFLAAKYNAKAVFGIDLSSAVEIAYQNTKHLPNVCIVQADIYNLPFREKSFDYAYSIGVLHHLPHPERGFDAILSRIKSGGMLTSWVYGRQGITVMIFNTLRKHIFAQLPFSANLYISWLATAILYPAIKFFYLPLNESYLTKSIARYLPLNSFMAYLGGFDFRMIHDILFDQMVAPTAFYYTGDEFKRWFKKATIASFTVTERNKNSWRGLAQIK